MSETMWMFSVKYSKYDRLWPIAVFDELYDGKEFGQHRAERHFHVTHQLNWTEDDGDDSALVLVEGNRWVEYVLTLIARNPVDGFRGVRE